MRCMGNERERGRKAIRMSAEQREAARQALRSWRRRSDSVTGDRDSLVRNAIGAGLSIEEVHVITGLGRTTISRITARTEGDAQ